MTCTICHRTRAEVERLTATLDKVRALADEEEQRWRDNPAPTNADAGRYGVAMRLRAALEGGRS